MFDIANIRIMDSSCQSQPVVDVKEDRLACKGLQDGRLGSSSNQEKDSEKESSSLHCSSLREQGESSDEVGDDDESCESDGKASDNDSEGTIPETGYTVLSAGKRMDEKEKEKVDQSDDSHCLDASHDSGLGNPEPVNWQDIKVEPVDDDDRDYCSTQVDYMDEISSQIVDHDRSTKGKKSSKWFSENPMNGIDEIDKSGADDLEGLINGSMVGVTGDKRFTCTICDKSFKGNSSLIKHIRIHTGEKPFNCNVCSKSFAQKSNLKTHLKIHSGEKPHICDICDKGFISMCDLTHHMSVHTGQKRYQCPEANCDRGFNTKYKLKIHLRFHTGERPYHCSVCGKDFTRPYDLKIHFRTHTEEKNHECGICQKRFKRNTELTAHIRTHTGEKPYTCPICFRSFAESGSLANHKRIHTGEMPYSCGVCNKEFHHSSNLKRHMKSHIGDKPFQCQVCQRCFCTTSDLKRHSEIHLDNQSKRFKCSICDKGFRRSDHLKKHMKMHFGEKAREREGKYDNLTVEVDYKSILPTVEDVKAIVSAIPNEEVSERIVNGVDINITDSHGVVSHNVGHFSINSFHNSDIIKTEPLSS